MIKKAPLIRALKAIARAYNNNSHKLDTNTCPLCLLYRVDIAGDCTICPMRLAFKACGRRQCSPVECLSHGRKIRNVRHMDKLEVVREFYNKTIKRVNKMTVGELNKHHAWDFLIELDRKIAEEYGVTREVSEWRD
jgi:hypothetical protein